MSSTSSYISDLVDLVHNSGRQITGVFDPEHQDPTFFYSIGNSSYKGSYPLEFISWWQTDKTPCGLINDVGDGLHALPDLARQVAEGGAMVTGALGAEAEFGVILRPLTGFLARVTRERYACALTNPAFFGEDLLMPNDLIQILIPDLQGVFPGEEGCHPAINEWVPESLRLPEDWTPGVVVDYEDLLEAAEGARRLRPRRPHRPSNGFGDS